MRIHSFKNDPKKLLEIGQSIVSSSSETKFLQRVVIVNLMLSSGLSARQFSKLFGIPYRTLSLWISKVDEQGFEALRAIKQDGRPRRLQDSQIAEICETIKKAPTGFGYKVWDGPSLSDFIRTKYNVTLGIRQCQRLLRQQDASMVSPKSKEKKPKI